MDSELKELPDSDGMWWRMYNGRPTGCFEVYGNDSGYWICLRTGSIPLRTHRDLEDYKWIKAEPPVFHPLEGDESDMPNQVTQCRFTCSNTGHDCVGVYFPVGDSFACTNLVDAAQFVYTRGTLRKWSTDFKWV